MPIKNIFKRKNSNIRHLDASELHWLRTKDWRWRMVVFKKTHNSSCISENLLWFAQNTWTCVQIVLLRTAQSDLALGCPWIGAAEFRFFNLWKMASFLEMETFYDLYFCNNHTKRIDCFSFVVKQPERHLEVNFKSIFLALYKTSWLLILEFNYDNIVTCVISNSYQ